MKQIKNCLIALVAFAAIGGIAACKKDNAIGCQTGEEGYPDSYDFCSRVWFEIPPTNAANGKTFKYEKFLDLLEDSLSGIGGYQVTISEGGFPKLATSKGFARGPKACPPMDLTTCHKMNIASVTKMFTAAVTLKLLYEQGLDENDSIGPFLPSTWNVPVSVQNLTFAQMLSHRSGMHMNTANTDFSNTLSYSGLKTFAEAGTNTDSIGLQRYRNANVALMRIIIPELWKKVNSCPQDLKNAGAITDALSKTYYDRALKNLLFAPAGVDATLNGDELDEYKALYYSLDSNATGHAEGDWTGIAGGGGWYMSANDLAAVANGIFLYGVIDPAIANNMITGRMGIWNAANTIDGTFWGHGGDISGSGYEMHSVLLVNQANGLVIAININSTFNPASSTGLTNAVRQAYDGAWE